MEIRKITGLDPADPAALERAFEGIEAQPIASCNWPDAFAYAPQVRFRMFHTGDRLLLRFEVEERYTAALVTEDNGEVWTDSCVEFFLAPGDERAYYNFETTAIGCMLLGYRTSHADAVHASPEILAGVARTTTYPAGVPFAERTGDNRWMLMLAIPPEALFRHHLTTWDGLTARINLYKCGDRLSHPHFLSWQPVRTEKPDFHRPEFFKGVHFAAR